MRKIFTVILFVSSLLALNAQIEKGSKVIRGNLNFRYDTRLPNQDFPDHAESDYESWAYGLSPSFGYFIKDNLFLGLSLGYYGTFTHDERTSIDGDETEISRYYNSYSFSPTLRHFISLGNSLYFTTSGSLGISFGENKVYYENEEYEESSYISDLRGSAVIAPGLTYFFRENMAINAQWGSIMYSYIFDNNPGYDYNRHLVDVDLSLRTTSFGFEFYF